MRRIAFLFAFVVTAVLIPGKVRAQGVAGVPTISAAVASAIDGVSQAVVVARAALPSRHSTGRNVGMAVAWLLIVSVVGFGVMAFGADKLQIVVNTMQGGIGKSLGTGILGQLAILPGAIAVAALLAATLIGVLLIPLGLVAFMMLVAGIAMLGFIAVAIMTGAALSGGKKRDDTQHGAMLRSFFTGTAIYLGMWILVAAFSGLPLIGAMLESFASAVTFVAVTTGFGAVLLAYWRGDFRISTTT
jgi:hypothetical protein